MNEEIKIRLEATTEAAARAAAENIALALADEAVVTFYTLIELKSGWRFEGVIRQKESSTNIKSSLLTIDYVTLKRFVKIVNEQDATKIVSARAKNSQRPPRKVGFPHLAQAPRDTRTGRGDGVGPVFCHAPYAPGRRRYMKMKPGAKRAGLFLLRGLKNS